MHVDPAALLDTLLRESEDFVVVLDEGLGTVERSASWAAQFGPEVGFLDSLLTGARSTALRVLRRSDRQRRTVDLVHTDRAGRVRRVAWRAVASDHHHLLLGRDLAEDDRRLDQILRLQHDFRRTSAELRRLANTDPVTGVANRRAVLDAGRWVWSRGGPATVILLDLDHFKRVNDRHGHEAGDAVLEAVGKTLQGAVGAGNVVGRWGGEEFACFLGGASAEPAERMADALRSLVVEDGTVSLRVTASFGVALVPDVATISLTDALAAADTALYVAKEAGRDRVVARQLEPRVGAGEPGEERRAPRVWRTRTTK